MSNTEHAAQFRAEAAAWRQAARDSRADWERKTFQANARHAAKVAAMFEAAA
jgi:hypothetical protein